jgi:hypothetical protein
MALAINVQLGLLDIDEIRLALKPEALSFEMQVQSSAEHLPLRKTSRDDRLTFDERLQDLRRRT